MGLLEFYLLELWEFISNSPKISIQFYTDRIILENQVLVNQVFLYLQIHYNCYPCLKCPSF